MCVLIRTHAKILKPWYTRSVVDRTITLQDLFYKSASGEFDDGGKNIDIQTTQVRNANIYVMLFKTCIKIKQTCVFYNQYLTFRFLLFDLRTPTCPWGRVIIC